MQIRVEKPEEESTFVERNLDSIFVIRIGKPIQELKGGTEVIIFAKIGNNPYI